MRHTGERDDLFYNTPARFKFLKSDTTERRYIAECSRPLPWPIPASPSAS